ncbi:phosphocarrier protein [Parelusimicrobium proximum]|uniref:HPr family phosphocarrier protein n=1 Tax=Parelusimicrobium proximum TaxID=3228953 RepID=UPI003D175145
MINDNITIKNKMGLHARPSALLAKTAAAYKSEITLNKDNVNVNAKSIMGILMLAAECGAEIKLSVSGEDEQEAFDAVRNILSGEHEEGI